MYDILNPNEPRICTKHKTELRFISIRDGYKSCTECNKIKGYNERKKNILQNRDSKFNEVDCFLKSATEIVCTENLSKKFNVSKSYITKFLNKNNLEHLIQRTSEHIYKSKIF